MYEDSKAYFNQYVGPPYTRTKITLPAYITRQQQLSIDICCLRTTSAANPPANAAAVNRRDRQMDTRPFYEAYRILCVLRKNESIRSNEQQVGQIYRLLVLGVAESELVVVPFADANVVQSAVMQNANSKRKLGVAFTRANQKCTFLYQKPPAPISSCD